MSEKKKIVFIVNPISGNQDKSKLENIIPLSLDLSLFNWELKNTRKQGDAERWSKEASIDQADIVVAVGGDGTINEVARGLINSTTALAVIPRGSGNGFANYFKIPKDAAQAIQVINQLNICSIDTGRFEERLFLCVGGLGFDAQVAHAFDNHNKRGFLSYIQLTLREFSNYNPATYRIKQNGSVKEIKGIFVTAANSTQFGNNAQIAPKADISDGQLELVILKPFPLWQSIPLAIRLFTGTFHKFKYVETLSVDEVVIESDNNMAQVDGEPFQCSNNSTIKIEPSSLRMVC